RPPPRSGSWRSCWTGRPRTDRSPCRRTWKRPSATSRDSRTASNSGPRRDRIESGPGRRLARGASVPLLRGIFRVNPFERLWPHALQLHVAHAIPDFAEEDLLLHPVSEPDRPADFRPRAAVALWDDVHEILRVVRLRVALVGAEVGAVLEAGLRDDRAVPEKVDDDLDLPERSRRMTARVRLPDAVIRQIALFVHEPEEERLPDRRGFLRPPEEFREVEHRAFAQRPHPIFARRLLRR